MPTDEETPEGFRVMVRERLRQIAEKLETIHDYEERIRALEARQRFALGFAYCLSSLSALAALAQFLTR